MAYFIDVYKPGAGTENQLRGVLQYLDPERVEAKLYTLRDEVRPEHRREIPWPIECLRVGSLANVGSLMKFIKLVWRLKKEKYDIVLIYFDDSNLFVAPACQLAGIKNCVINRRNMGYALSHEILRKLNWVNRRANYFLVNSEAVKRKVIELERFPAERIKVIYNGMWDKNPDQSGAISPLDIGLPDNARVVGIAANLRPVKRIDRFIDVAGLIAGRVPNAHFLILGQGEDKDGLHRRAEDLGVASKIHFLGHIDNIYPYLSLFDVGVLTSESEGLPNTLIEYCRVGVASVAFDTGGNKEVIKDGVSGYLVPEGDIAGMADKVINILSDTECRNRLSLASKEVAAKMFAPDKIMKEIMDFYEAIVLAPKNGWRVD